MGGFGVVQATSDSDRFLFSITTTEMRSIIRNTERATLTARLSEHLKGVFVAYRSRYDNLHAGIPLKSFYQLRN